MGRYIPTREDALQLLKEYNPDDSLVRHGLAVEGVMRYMARKIGDDEDMWGIVGLVHDLDYYRFPEEHCQKSKEILEEKGWPEEYIRAVISHGWGMCSEVKPETALEKTLFAIDELIAFLAFYLISPWFIGGLKK